MLNIIHVTMYTITIVCLMYMYIKESSKRINLLQKEYYGVMQLTVRMAWQSDEGSLLHDCNVVLELCSGTW